MACCARECVRAREWGCEGASESARERACSRVRVCVKEREFTDFYSEGLITLSMILKYQFISWMNDRNNQIWVQSMELPPLWTIDQSKGAFSLHRASDPPRTGRSRRTFYPQKWSEKASSGTPRTLSRTPNRLSPRDKMSRTSDSSTNQMVFHGVTSNVHSFPVSY